MKKQTTKTDKTAIAGSLLLAADLTFPANQFEPISEHCLYAILSDDLSKLKVKLEKVEKELSKCRTSTIEDGWQTQKFARKSRKWDFYAQQKHEISLRINEIEAELQINTEGHIIRIKN